MKEMFIRLYNEEHAAVIAEYALMAALIAAALAATVSRIGDGVAVLIQKAVGAFSTGDGPSTGETAL